MTDWQIFVKMFFEVALLEELTKFLAFQWVTSQRKSRKYDLPIATMFYCMLASAGFAIVENIHYLMGYGEDVLLIRAVTAVMIHVICGLIMGYFIAKAKFITSEYNKKQYNLNPVKAKTKKMALMAAGIAAPMMLHGFYNYSLATSSGSIYATLVIMAWGLATSIFLIKETVEDSKKIKRLPIPKYEEQK